MVHSQQRSLTIAILALGGQGGGVLTRWLVDIAEQNDFLAQSTYVAGVAQRTGATVYCVDIFPKAIADEKDKLPVFNLYPVPGNVDLVITSELAEVGRAIQKGFVTPNITSLITSKHRVYGITEKTAMHDGITDQTPILAKAEKLSKQFVCFDMEALAQETGSVISAVILGAVAGSQALPFSRDSFEEAIRRDGRAVEANLRGFTAGLKASTQGSVPKADIQEISAFQGANGAALKENIEGYLPEDCRAVALQGALRLLDYQDRAYANVYVKKVRHMYIHDTWAQGESDDHPLTRHYARLLALQMSYEDTIRVADLKTRSERFNQIRQDLNAMPGQPAYVSEYFHPRYEEICDTLPASLGDRLLSSSRVRRLSAPFLKNGRIIQTNKLGGFLLLHTLSKFKRFRRGTYRYRKQAVFIEDWEYRIREALLQSYDYALATVDCMELVSGYGDTYHRGLTRYNKSIEAACKVPASQRAKTLRHLHTAASADEAGKHFEQALSELVFER